MSAAELTSGSILLFQKRLVRYILVFRWVPRRVAKGRTEDLSVVSTSGSRNICGQRFLGFEEG